MLVSVVRVISILLCGLGRSPWLCCCLTLCAGLAPATSNAAPPKADPLAVVDRPRLEQKLRRAADALTAAKERVSLGDRVLLDLVDEARAQLDQARSQLASERKAELWYAQRLEASQGTPPPAPTDAGVAPVRSRDPWGGSTSVEDRAAPHPKELPPGREALGEVGLRTLVNAMRGQAFRGGKLRVLAQAAPAYAFTVSQVIELLGEVTAPADRLEAMQLTVPHLADHENLPTLYRACVSDEERDTVQRLVGP